ncbi:MAG: hypothetical protein QG551_110 [Patescibacteria group bacterium]|jgi:hypothetical protein|nr:hypothetical protein [Patescibacteria group bacterium]
MKPKAKIVAGMHEIRQHAGQALLRTARIYPTLLRAIVEMVQNAVDKDVLAKRIEVIIDRVKREIIVRDDGDGTTEKKFEDALATVGTPSRKGDDALGKFGIGLIAPLGKCKKFTFTSRPKPGKGVRKDARYHSWTFECDKIVAQRDHVSVPHCECLSLSGGQNPWWSSEMRLEETVTDAAVADFELSELILHIVTTIGRRLRRQKTKLSIMLVDKDGSTTKEDEVKVADFSGDPLSVYTVQTENAGMITFRLFSRKNQRGHAQILFGRTDRDERITVKALQFNRLIGHDNPAFPILRSGFLEGEILADNLELKPDRDAFLETGALLDLGVALEEWTKTVGKDLMEQVKEDNSGERRQRLGMQTMAVIEALLSQPEFAGIRKVIDTVAIGNIGQGHVNGRVMKDPEPVVGKTLSGSKPASGSTNGGTNPKRSDEPTTKLAHEPKVVLGPKGGQRRFVRGHSTGLIFGHDMLEESLRPYEFDSRTGTLIFNTRHPAWVLVDGTGSDSAILEYQERVAVMALTEATLPAGVRESAHLIADPAISAFARLLVDGRKARRKAKDIEV